MLISQWRKSLLKMLILMIYLRVKQVFHYTDFTHRQNLRHEGEIRLQTKHLPMRMKSRNTVDLQFPVLASRQIYFLKLFNTRIT